MRGPERVREQSVSAVAATYRFLVVLPRGRLSFGARFCDSVACGLAKPPCLLPQQARLVSERLSNRLPKLFGLQEIGDWPLEVFDGHAKAVQSVLNFPVMVNAHADFATNHRGGVIVTTWGGAVRFHSRLCTLYYRRNLRHVAEFRTGQERSQQRVRLLASGPIGPCLRWGRACGRTRIACRLCGSVSGKVSERRINTPVISTKHWLPGPAEERSRSCCGRTPSRLSDGI